jgi:hypothetical protein
MSFCVMRVVVSYFIALYCPVLHCSTLPPGINPFAVNNSNNNNNNNMWTVKNKGDTSNNWSD